ncbi:MAG: hypothetical protein U9R68_02515 [Planctomycetota bacterium]|nr:hypothetical protein [Planctomycetota bacterium]
MSEFSNEIKNLLTDVERSAKDGSRELIAYAAQRRRVIADAIADDTPDAADVIRQELLNIKTAAATESVRQADRLDAAALQIVLTAFAAADTLLLASLD